MQNYQQYKRIFILIKIVFIYYGKVKSTFEKLIDDL